MSFSDLYDGCKGIELYVGRNEIRDRVLALTSIDKIRTVKTTLDISVCRGFLLRPQNIEHHLVRQLGLHVVVLARGMNRCWDRFVYVKEMMHLFDPPDEATDSGDKFDMVLSELTAGQGASVQMRAEVNCFWRALSALCPEKTRLQFKEQIVSNQITSYDVALQLKIPELYVPHLFTKQYEDKLAYILK